MLNDLLDPARANLKLREDPKRGFYVEGIKEETLVSAEHALSVIATGVAHRKVRVCYVLAAAALVHKDYLWLFTTSLRRHPLPPGFIATRHSPFVQASAVKCMLRQRAVPDVLQVSATSFNEGSSRSHTLLRLSIESSQRPDIDADPNSSVVRTLSFLNLIDLAGSESAKAAVNKGHRTEGSYINKSLLTLGTVIAKLSDGNAAHIPFRDSKLTRLLQVLFVLSFALSLCVVIYLDFVAWQVHT